MPQAVTAFGKQQEHQLQQEQQQQQQQQQHWTDYLADAAERVLARHDLKAILQGALPTVTVIGGGGSSGSGSGSTWKAKLHVKPVNTSTSMLPTRTYVATLRDVTASMEREKLFGAVIDEAIDAILTINTVGIITLVNRSAVHMFGYDSEADLVGKNVGMLMPEPHRERHDSYIAAHLSTGQKRMIGTDRTVTAQRRDGSQFQCRLGLSKINVHGTKRTDDGDAIFVGLLLDARAKLADQMRQQKALFLASMSHEIRTPLNGIFGMLELLQSTSLDQVQSEWLATCSRSAQSLTTILDDILLFSRADGGGLQLERLSFNIRDIVEDVVTVLASQTIDKGVDLVYTVSRRVPESLIGDPTRLRQVLLIFLSNALKFTQVGHVALEVSLDGQEGDGDNDDDDEHDYGSDTSTTEEDCINYHDYAVKQQHHHNEMHGDGKHSSAKKERRHHHHQQQQQRTASQPIALKLEISDTGNGMSKKQIKKLFQPFTQADESTTRQYGGTGLGLSIAKKLVTLMKGNITVESRPNRGSTFTATTVLESDPDGSRTCDLHDNITPADLELLRGTHILSIDDNAVNAEYLVNLLKLLGCRIKGARSGVDGIEQCKLAALREDPYEILLLDFAMPCMSGLEVAETIAASSTIAATRMRVLMLGSIDTHRNIAACPYVHGFTTKPIRRVPLIKMIVEQLKIQRGLMLNTVPSIPVSTSGAHQEEGQVNPEGFLSDDDATPFPEEVPAGPVPALPEGPVSGGLAPTTKTAITPSPTSANGNNKRFKPLSFLLVEDNLINQKVIVNILTRWKVKVTTAVNGLSGFEERTQHRGRKSFDMILCDLHMPACDGFQCVEMIRRWEKANSKEDATKVCAITADVNPDTRNHCLSELGGFDEFLTKPLRKNALRDMIVKLCGPGRLAELPEGSTTTYRSNVPDAASTTSCSSTISMGTQEGTTASSTHVLVCDDAPTMRLLLSTFLKEMGCTVSEASSDEEAVDLVRNNIMTAGTATDINPIELVICDMRMPPGIDGFETVRRIKQIAGTAQLPIIGMTAADTPSAELQKARAVGMVSLVTKPIGKADLATFLVDYTGTVPSERLQTDQLHE